MSVTDPLDQFSSELREKFASALATARTRTDVSGVDIGRNKAGALEVRTHVRATSFLPGGKQDVSAHLKGFDLDVTLIVAPYELDVAALSRAADKLDATNSLDISGGREIMHMPLRPGISVAGDGLLGGTIGLIVFDENERAHVLGNAHVLGVNTLGEQKPDDHRTEQPADTRKNRRVAGLTDVVHGNDGDAAICAIDAKTAGGDTITYCLSTFAENESDSVVIGGTASARIGTIVRKSGVRTRVTTGVIEGIGHYFIGSTAKKGGFRGFRIAKLADSDPMPSSNGDSGAVWYERDGNHRGIGLHVGGDGTFAIACHLEIVLYALNVGVDPPAHAPNMVSCSAG